MKPYILLIDDINETKTYANANTLNKVEYNCDVLDLSFEIGVNTALAQSEGISYVLQVGRYIVIIRSNKDETSKEMHFFDYESNMDFRLANSTILDETFSENIVNSFENIKSKMLSDFKSSDDVFELVKTKSEF